MKTTLIRGLPVSLQQDGWWLWEAPRAAGVDGTSSANMTGSAARLGLLALLILLGDAFIWQVVPGLSLAMFCAALVSAALIVVARQISSHRVALVVGVTLLSLLPLVELVQPLSLLLAAFGVSGALALAAGLRADSLLCGALRLWPLGVKHTFASAVGPLRGQGADNAQPAMRRLAMAWLMPLVIGGAFVLLLTDANPVLDRWLHILSRNELPRIDRSIFWLVLVPFCWTALCLQQITERLRQPISVKADTFGPRPEGLINPASVTRALIVFNAVFAAQTVLDITYLYGGAALPDGITYAQYAHRGAYPLVLTALLAGGFALVTRRWTECAPLLRLGLMLFVAQNVVLVISALVRLNLYVEMYGLTRLRIAAALWMFLTATGLALTLWQIWAGRPNRWLMLRSVALGGATLWGASLFSFDAVIARHNLTAGILSDAGYICTLGEAARPEIERYNRANRTRLCQGNPPRVSMPDDWREWGFRNWRVRTSLGAIQPEKYP